MSISTRDLSGLPDIQKLLNVCKSIALLDAIICPEWEYRYYSFNSKWADGEQMASMRNGSGDDYFIVFSRHGAIIRGFAHESPMSPYGNDEKIWPGVLDSVPAEFSGFLKEPAFHMEDTTFCIWRLNEDEKWNVGEIAYPKQKTYYHKKEKISEYEDPDGSAGLLSILDGDYNSYIKFAEEYFADSGERKIDVRIISDVYNHKPLNDGMIKRINPDIDLESLKNEIEEIGYPG